MQLIVLIITDIIVYTKTMLLNDRGRKLIYKYITALFIFKIILVPNW